MILKNAKHEHFAGKAVCESGDPYVYALADSLTGVVFYIGKGRGRRMFNHERDAKRGKPGVKNNRIREILSSGASVECRVLAVFDTDREAYMAEKRFIAEHKNLTNMNSGGGGSEPVGARVKNLLERIKPYTQWLSGLSGEQAVVVIKVWGSFNACYEFVSRHLSDNARRMA